MTETLLWNLDEVARQLGNVSTRTVRRMLERGELPSIRIGRAVRIPADAVREWVDQNMTHPHNQQCAGPDVRGVSTCQKSATGTKMVSTREKIRHTGGSATSTQVARELAAVLELSIERKPRRS
jgi:excisionase family DNA binding protein